MYFTRIKIGTKDKSCLEPISPLWHLLYKAKQLLIRTNKIEITVLRPARIRFEVAALPNFFEISIKKVVNALVYPKKKISIQF